MADANKLKIWCGVLGIGSMFSVEIARDASVAELRKEVASNLNEGTTHADVAAHRLELFKRENPQIGDAKLVCGPNLETFLKQGRVPATGFKEMDPLWNLDDDDCFGSALPTREGELHVLVQLPDDPRPTKRQRTEELDLDEVVVWQNTVGVFAPLPMRDKDRFLTLPYAYVEGSGLHSSGTDVPVVLYRRQALLDAWHAIQTYSIDSYAQLFMAGPSGAGKSCAAFAFACTCVDRTLWTIVWIHWLCIKIEFSIVVFDGYRKATTRFQRPAFLQTILVELEAHHADKKVLVFLDGVVETFAETKQAQDVLSAWQFHESKTRRFVCVTSQAAVADYHHNFYGRILELSQDGCVAVRQRMKFDMPSWKLDEYVGAVQDAELVETIKLFLLHQYDGTTASDRTPVVDLVCAKFFYVGGCARHMFGYLIQEAIDALGTAIQYVGTADRRRQGNPLVGLYQRTADASTKNYIVSLYAARELTMKVGNAHRENLAQQFGFHASRDGWLLETWFMYALVTIGVSYCTCNLETRKENTALQKWKARVVHYYDSEADSPMSGLLHVGWYAPVDWRHAGYDAVHVYDCDGVCVTLDSRRLFLPTIPYKDQVNTEPELDQIVASTSLAAIW